MEEAGGKGLDELPHHLLYRILQSGNFGAVDLAHLEMSCYTFRAAGGILPYRFKSLIENIAFLYCQSDPLFLRLSPTLQSQLVHRYSGNWKLVLRFLQATHQGATGFSSATGKAQVVAGKYLTFLIKGQGKLFGCGSNQFGVLGQGPLVADCTSPVQVPVPTGCRVQQVTASHHHVAFVTEDGKVFTYGDNSSGCCGHGDTEGPIYKPTAVEALSSIPCKQVSTGLSFMAALTREGEIYSWGSASHGQLGHGDTADQSLPVRVESLTTVGAVNQIATGASYTLSLMENGDLYSFGYGANYCLGHNDSVSELQPRLVVLDEKSFITSVAAGDEHSVAIDSIGQVYTWGKGYCGALGHGDEDNVHKPKIIGGLCNVFAVQVSARRRKTFVVTDNGQMFAFGWMALGSLGLTDRGYPEKVLKPHRVMESGSLDKTDGHIAKRGRAGHCIARVSAGLYHTVCINSDGLFLAFGDNDKGQLNFDSEFPQRPPEVAA